jgi:cytochrome c biogenesis protein CcmG/thiol:disulfide interchange protein DsbE
MHTHRLPSFVIALAIVASAAGSMHASGPKPAPDVTVQTADGTPVHLSAFKGKVVLVDFWASWCTSCKTSFPALDVIHRDYQAKGVEIVAVNLDEKRSDADRFLGEHPHRLTVLFDPRGASPLAFGVKGMPTSFLIDRTGNIRFTHMGYSGDVEASYRQEIALLLAEH